jgi:rhamnosyltransferase
MIDKIAAAIILYNPSDSLIENINSVLNQVSKIYLLDNSEIEFSENLLNFFSSDPRIQHIRFNDNLGIAEALNIALRFADNDEFDYLLTLDQDSKSSENLVAELYKILLKNENIALVTALHFDPSQHKLKQCSSVDDILYTMTSGNLLRVKVAKSVGGFDSKLFIDHVDHEFCLRLKSNGYGIKKNNSAILFHKLGKSETKRFCGINFYPSHHNPIRIYYRTRNRLYVNKKYKNQFPDYVKEDLKHFLREFLDMILFEKQRLKKIQMIIKGYRDFKKNRFGKFYGKS